MVECDCFIRHMATCPRCQRVGDGIHICTAPKVQDRESKQRFGQFFTTNYTRVLQGLHVPEGIPIIEPFAGAGDLLRFLTPEQRQVTTCYDIEPRQTYILPRDTLRHPPSYIGSFLLTNPPYLARNKSPEKDLYEKYGVNDLYKCLLKELLTNQPVGGILIIPINFWCSVRKGDLELRRDFLTGYRVTRLNLFEERVFEDTSTTVCSFGFTLRNDTRDEQEEIPVVIYPSGREMSVRLHSSNFYLVGGEIHQLPVTANYQITRWTRSNRTVTGRTNLLVKCLDDSKVNRIGMRVVTDRELYCDETATLTARSFATLVITPSLSQEQQERLASDFNRQLEEWREKYQSLFLSHYRESKELARKRLSFDLLYRLVGYLLLKF